MNAPKKIWVEKRGTRVGWTSEPIISKPTDIPYIRADIVDELVEALNVLVAVSRLKSAIAEEDINPESPVGKGIAALAKLEKEV